MIEQMIEWLVGNGNSQFPHVGVIRLRQFARSVQLGEKDFLGRAFQSTPTLYSSLEGPQLSI